MQAIRERLIENARKYEFQMRSRYYAASSSETDDWYEIIHNHFLNSILPQIGMIATNLARELFVEYWPAEVLIGDHSRLVQGILTRDTYTHQYGTYGAGYFCITNRRSFVVSLAELTKRFSRFKISPTKSLLSGLIREVDLLSPMSQDKVWEVPHSALIRSAVTYSESSSPLIEVDSQIGQWKIFPHFKDTPDEMQAALAMALDVSMTNIQASRYIAVVPTVLSTQSLRQRDAARV